MTNQELKEAVELLREQATEQQNISTSLEGYLTGLKRLKGIQQTIVDNQKIELKLQKELDDARKSGSLTDVNNAKKKLKILQDQTDELTKQGKVLADNLDKVNKSNLLMTKLGASAVKSIGKLPDLFKNSYGKLKGFGLFEMSKSTKTAALQMGLLGNQAKSFGENIRKVSLDTNEIGIGMEQLSKMQSSYSNELGRTVELSNQGLKAMAAMAAATGLGEEGSAAMAANMDAQGLSAESTKDYLEQTMNDSHKMGLNTSKVIKNIAGNMKMLNKYNFKGGVKGLAKMAQTTTKLGIGMEFVGTMAEKLFDIEGAVDMSAQLQVLGGAWAQLADPFKLMYLATNDMAGLTEEVGKAAEASVNFNKQTGEMSISSAKMRELRVVAQATGLSLEEVAEAGKKARKFTEMKKQMNFTIPPDLKDFMAATGEMDEHGEAKIKIGGDSKFIKTLKESDITALRTQMGEKKSMEERAKASQTFDDALTNTINMFKTAMLPLVETMNTDLMPKINDLVKRFKDGKWAEKIGEFATTIGKMVSFFAGWVIDNPIKSALVVGAAKLTSFIMGKLEWIMNGRMLAKGFLSGTGGAGGAGGKGGSFLDSIGGKEMRVGGKMMKSGRLAKGAGTMLKGFGKGSGALSLVGAGIDVVTNAMDDNLSITDKFLKTLDQNKGMAAGAAIGSIIPGVGTLIGAGIGGIVDMFTPEIGTYGKTSGDVNAGYFPPSKSKNHGRQIIQDGIATPIHDEDKAMIVGKKLAAKDTGKTSSIGGSSNESKVTHTFEPLIIKGEIMVNAPGTTGIDLLKDQNFIRKLSASIMTSIETNKNGGALKG